ncbi:hypothetical protein CBM2585_A130342 [Cupriavidus taiwanensis]|nr:hypothetical protein CBM2585_A130342 [Cupriavidus taiwanensis]
MASHRTGAALAAAGRPCRVCRHGQRICRPYRRRSCLRGAPGESRSLTRLRRICRFFHNVGNGFGPQKCEFAEHNVISHDGRFCPASWNNFLKPLI